VSCNWPWRPSFRLLNFDAFMDEMCKNRLEDPTGYWNGSYIIMFKFCLKFKWQCISWACHLYESLCLSNFQSSINRPLRELAWPVVIMEKWAHSENSWGVKYIMINKMKIYIYTVSKKRYHITTNHNLNNHYPIAVIFSTNINEWLYHRIVV